MNWKLLLSTENAVIGISFSLISIYSNPVARSSVAKNWNFPSLSWKFDMLEGRYLFCTVSSLLSSIVSFLVNKYAPLLLTGSVKFFGATQTGEGQGPLHLRTIALFHHIWYLCSNCFFVSLRTPKGFHEYKSTTFYAYWLFRLFEGTAIVTCQVEYVREFGTKFLY